MMTFALTVGASLLANLQSPASPVREQARSYKKMETAV
ncbi:hypothetical protein HNP46_002321 [Pseudomonas nitritireducens]|uniref:Uncharacterized protein n=1 Tax=Pseudomonas nitroreducens TaxID=46680 RepID=A0A7W7KIP1_PSENT|nr:hypothetical protein [Pseudomonas nitritireducens]